MPPRLENQLSIAVSGQTSLGVFGSGENILNRLSAIFHRHAVRYLFFEAR